MPRLFIGILLPQAYQKNLKSLTDMLGSCLESRCTWTKSGNWHLTLKFLGDVDEAQVGDVQAALRKIDFPAFSMRAGGCGLFPSPEKPRVLWKGLRMGAEKCGTLATQIEEALAPLGFERDRRPFTSHLTIGRIKKLGKDDWPGCLRTIGNGAWPAFTADRFILWQSDLKSEGAEYTVIEEFELYSEK